MSDYTTGRNIAQVYLSLREILNSRGPSRKKSALHKRGSECILSLLNVNLPQAHDVPREPHTISSSP